MCKIYVCDQICHLEHQLSLAQRECEILASTKQYEQQLADMRVTSSTMKSESSQDEEEEGRLIDDQLTEKVCMYNMLLCVHTHTHTHTHTHYRTVMRLINLRRGTTCTHVQTHYVYM